MNDSGIYPEWAMKILILLLFSSCSLTHEPAPARDVPMKSYYVSKVERKPGGTYAKVKGLRGWYHVHDTTKEKSFITIGWIKK